ncbi:MAG: undecaprenyldiphospho-muramoylpentapeptide beta-N-acetylglucosaminyltransferase [Burkholderiales bacterium]|nr:undecaprenyldiphospho-muramoylpentapeptide beta-N-acetylglucosaminyltransferase [Burkholderiales bacterium]
MNASRTIMIMAGGTGGHVFPALAVADFLRDLGWRVVWLGTRRGMEADLVPKRGYEMAWVNFSGIRGKGAKRLLTLPLELLLAFWQSARALLRHRPQVVLGMGGYVTIPGGMMASLFNKPLVIHEQNSLAGSSNRVLAKLADRVLIAFPNALKARSVAWTGNPVRTDIASLPTPGQRFRSRSGRLRVLVVGGSLGAQALNETVPRALRLIAESARPLVTHQAGAKHLQALREHYADAGVTAEAELLAFIEDMAAAYGNADLVICRAGALTVSELAAAGVASVLVPFPFAVDDHQTHNARFLADHGAAILIPQAEFNPRRLADLLLGLTDENFTREKLLDMARRARDLAKPDATRLVAEACMEVAR